ncbi:MAG: sulfite exporter TauE/SafE family protein [Planctomycetaceae bacterium]
MAFLAGIALAVLLGAVVQSTVGFGFALLMVPIVTVIADPKVAVVTMTAIGLPLSCWNAIRWREHILVPEAARVTAASLVGMPVGALLLTKANDAVLTALVGAVVLVLTVALWRRFALPAGRRSEYAAGAVAGALATSVGTSGPPVVIAFQAAGLEPEPFRATLAAAFLVEGAIALAAFWTIGLVDAEVGRGVLVGIPAMILGVVAGERAFRRIDHGGFRAIVLALLALSGLLALASAATR